MPVAQPEVGPTDELTWGINWKKWLNGRVIVDAVWTAEAPIVILGQSFDSENTLVKVRVAGVHNQSYMAACEATFDTAEKETRRISWRVVTDR
jgi:hypothetical protein